MRPAARLIISVAVFVSEAGLALQESPGRSACGDFERILKAVDRCEANASLAALALRCTLQVESESGSAARNLLERLGQGTSAQRGALAMQSSNLEAADKTLAALEARNEAAIRDSLQYFLMLVHPDSLYEPGTGDPNALLRATPCFRDNKRKLLIALTELERNKAGLTEARDTLKALRGKTGQESLALLSAALGKVGGKTPPARGAPAGSSFGARKHPKPESDITGTRPRSGDKP